MFPQIVCPWLHHGIIVPGLPGCLSVFRICLQCRRHRDSGSIPGLGRSPGGGHGNPLQYSCLEDPMERGAWRMTVHGVKKSQTRLKRLSSSSGHTWPFPSSSAGKESTCNSGDPVSIPESRRSAGEGKGYPLQCSWASLVAQLVKNLPAMQEIWVQSLGWEYPLEKGMATC